MKKAFGFILVAASLLLVSGAQAQAQGLHVRADVPFNFVIGNTAYTAGSYDVQGATTNHALIVRSNGKQGMVLPVECTSSEPAKKTVLVFKEAGGEYFLYQIWTAGSDTGRQLPQPKGETRLAREGNTQEVIVAANLVK